MTRRISWTSLTDTLGATTLGDLTYTYDAAGKRAGVGGRLARTNLPPALTSATYDAANRIARWGGTSFTYDLNPEPHRRRHQHDTWNAESLGSLSGGVSASSAYDGLRRRRGKTIGGTTTSFVYDGLNFVQERPAAAHRRRTW